MVELLFFQIVLAVARLFWLERKMKKAKEWFIKAVKLNPDLGDTWATYYKFTAAHGTEDELKVLVSFGFKMVDGDVEFVDVEDEENISTIT